jgi:rhamnose utilization protein RhaD (predicted bifunctional aldolase and dehydrogenase)/NAD(P)-dependent dehydrogenase (short-subunit alcohol dehydrogenase family)
MRSRWSEDEAAIFLGRYAPAWGEPLALRTYSSRLLGEEPDLVIHGGGNSSVKTMWKDILGREMPAIYVKASGVDMASVEPEDHPGLDLEYLRKLRTLADLDDASMVEQLRTHLLHDTGLTPSIEALVHAFLPGIYVDHTHADAILALTNREGGEKIAAEALGEEVIVLPYVTPGFKLAKAVSAALKARPAAWGMVWAQHGIVTWGDTARESYELMIRLVSRAEEYLAKSRTKPAPSASRKSTAAQSREQTVAEARLALVAPILRGLLAARTGDHDRPFHPVVLQSLTKPAIIAALNVAGAREALVSPALTTDHLIRTKPRPLWIDKPAYDRPEALRLALETAVARYVSEYEDYLTRHKDLMPDGVEPFDPQPRVVMLPGLGVVCAGPDLREAEITRDIAEHTIAVKTSILAAGAVYRGLGEEELFRMEYRTLQHAKLGKPVPRAAGGARGRKRASAAAAVDGSAGRAPLHVPGASQAHPPLRGRVALVTGAAGAIGTGICEALLEAGCLVAATDLPGAPLDALLEALDGVFPRRIVGLPLDVTRADSVSAAFAEVARLWGGVDLVIPNAGVAMVAPLADLDLERYRKLEKVNVEGTLLVLAEAGRRFREQGTGGDVVLVSTKNVFAPGANFGAYSSTKAAAHQLARIASLEFAADDVRVNMVAPDAVFSCGACKSGLWAEVGPERMKARGLDEAGLEAYYQSRNLLKAQVTAGHVANAVLFFATRQTPTTGATIPVDGGLPDATPR